MGHLNLSATRRNCQQWRLLDLVSAVFFFAVFVFFLLLFSPLGDSLAASGRRTLAASGAADPRQRGRLLSLVDGGQWPAVDACPVESVDRMPCEDPRRNGQLSRDMNFHLERHCPAPEKAPLPGAAARWVPDPGPMAGELA